MFLKLIIQVLVSANVLIIPIFISINLFFRYYNKLRKFFQPLIAHILVIVVIISSCFSTDIAIAAEGFQSSSFYENRPSNRPVRKGAFGSKGRLNNSNNNSHGTNSNSSDSSQPGNGSSGSSGDSWPNNIQLGSEQENIQSIQSIEQSIQGLHQVFDDWEESDSETEVESQDEESQDETHSNYESREQRDPKLEMSGLSKNHPELTEEERLVEELTKLRRSGDFRTTPYVPEARFSDAQLYRKGKRHIEDFKETEHYDEEFFNDIANKTPQEIANEYYRLINAQVLSKGTNNLDVQENGRLCELEDTLGFGEPVSKIVTIFEKKPQYRDNNFITAYELGEAYEKYKNTGKVGKSPEERIAEMNQAQQEADARARQECAKHRCFQAMPKEFRLSNAQFREAELLNDRLIDNPAYPLTQKQQDLLNRAIYNSNFKDKFCRDNPGVNRDDL